MASGSSGITKDDVAGDPNYYVVRQGYALIGLAGMVGMTLIDPGFWRKALPARLRTAPVHARADPILGTSVRNAPLDRSARSGSSPPSSGKLLLVLFLAAFLAERGKRIYERQTTTAAIGLAAVPILLVFLQPDFGTAIVYAAILGAALFIAGTRWSEIAVLLGLSAVAATFVLWIGPAIGVDVLKDYQRERIVGFTNPSKDPGGATWNITSRSPRSEPAGGPDEVPRARRRRTTTSCPSATDFVFASTAEQRGSSA